MRDNYFITTNSNISTNSNIQNINYLQRPYISTTRDIYTMEIESDLNIFSDIPLSLFSESAGKQVSKVMTEFKREYIRYVYHQEYSSVLPKLRYYHDEDGALIVQLASSWKSGNASVYFAFEKEEDNSSFGMVWNDQIKRNFESRSGNISKNDTGDIIREVIDFIFRVY